MLLEEKSRPMFVVPTTSKSFSAIEDIHAADKLVEILTRDSDNTQLLAIRREQDLLVGEDGLVQGKFRLTPLAISQICAATAPRLWRVIEEVSGFKKDFSPINSSRVAYSQTLCARWLNDIIRLRFSLLRDYKMVLDHDRQSVEGVVGRQYQLVSNLSVFNVAKTALESASAKPVFMSATLSGRRFSVCFFDQKIAAKIILPGCGKPDKFNGGYYFSNTETGDFSIRSGVAIVRRLDGTRSFRSLRVGSLMSHRKRGAFNAKLKQLIRKTVSDAQKNLDLAGCLRNIAQHKLQLGGYESTHNRAVARWKKKAAAPNVMPNAFGEAVLERTIWQGSYRESRIVPSPNFMTDVSERTVFDLYNSMTYEAMSLPFELRELAETEAFRLFCGKLLQTERGRK